MPSLPPNLVDPASAPLLPQDVRVLSNLDPALRKGLALERWWRKTMGPFQGPLDRKTVDTLIDSGPLSECFHLTRPTPLWPENIDYGFFHDLRLGNRSVPVMGFVCQLLFDIPKIHISKFYFQKSVGAPEQRFRKIYRDILDNWEGNLKDFFWKHLLNARSCT